MFGATAFERRRCAIAACRYAPRRLADLYTYRWRGQLSRCRRYAYRRFSPPRILRLLVIDRLLILRRRRARQCPGYARSVFTARCFDICQLHI